MGARIPPALDDEDPVVFGLTAQRGAYVLVSALVVLTALRSSMPGPARLAMTLAAATVGAAFGWGRWASRPADLWLWDLVLYLKENHRLRLLERGEGSASSPGARG